MTKREVIYITQKSKLAFRFMKWLDRHISKNKYGLVSGWWQCWKFDRWAFEYINRVEPTNKQWLTKQANISFYYQLCDTDELIIGASTPVIRENEKGNREAVFTLVLWCGAVQISSATFVFVEKEHNFCRRK